MPRQAQEMTALEVKRLTYKQVSGRDKGLPVFKAVGGVAGLHLQLTDGEGRSWVLRYSLPGGRRRSTGLGAYPEVGLADARDRAREAKDLIKQGKDPIVVRDDRRKALEAELNRMTFAQAIDWNSLWMSTKCYGIRWIWQSLTIDWTSSLRDRSSKTRFSKRRSMRRTTKPALLMRCSRMIMAIPAKTSA